MADDEQVVKKLNGNVERKTRNTKNKVKVEHVVVKPKKPVVNSEKPAHMELITEPSTGTVTPVVPSHPTVVKTGFNTLALVSFISSLLFFLPFHWLVGVITGHIALKQLKQNPAQEGDWAARSGLIISYVFLGLAVAFIMFIVGLGLLGVFIASMF